MESTKRPQRDGFGWPTMGTGAGLALWLLAVGASAAGALRPVPLTEVQIAPDSFWGRRIAAQQEVGLPRLWDEAERQGKVDNFRLVAGLKKQGRLRLYNAPDSDVYKLVEATGYLLTQQPAPQLRERVSEVVAAIVGAQQPDGYLNTQFSLPRDDPRAPEESEANRRKIKTFGYGPADRWAAEASRWPYAYSQLYCAGHLMEAAVAWRMGTGDESLLGSAVKLADHLERVFGEDPETYRRYADHPEVEIGLVRLYEATGEARYLALAERFARYARFARPVDLGGGVNRRPLAEQREAWGHAVRTAYVYTGATECLRYRESSDLRSAVHTLWSDVAAHKLYVHGGTGNGSPAEQHGLRDDLPIGATYSETCASIAQAQWGHALNLLTGEASYADAVEWQTYNNSLAGVSLRGDEFFYANKLNLGPVGRHDEHSGVRKHYLFCCPSKAPVLVTGVGRWAYAVRDGAFVINQYLAGSVETSLGDTPLRLEVKTDYPWSGEIALRILEAPSNELTLRLRVPGWCREAGPLRGAPYAYVEPNDTTFAVQVNGKQLPASVDDFGYAAVVRRWRGGDEVTLSLSMSPRRILTDQRIAANRGRVALSRGPLLYCLEGIDQRFELEDFQLPRGNRLYAEWRPDLLGGVMTLHGVGSVPGHRGLPGFVAIPYFAWQNRGVHAVATLLVEDAEALTPESPPSTEPMNTSG